ncbi:hypothetical protein CONCODRAFT_12489 [Conidiobolus coronatus NRRL 28638]|uniref:F-box domain-containing protein n=1 Tax=Conidiobolus coronatus (strain ATCC 28846 / CBS 209.66 / NRRL 28638) TaxID=796925 RepID=A0A137NT02_CONC2|nr:hypothetical protein CONCODRAFT_12489 [Conidiobolus coronatus NRRL 28638]|eukprot:KXN65814.1 hypothetical protein CONCODRAFT_12489 [Conidiobolus coronatus NRRL 28638]
METNKANRKSDIWNINSILSNIFAYSDHKDLIKFNSVCKKWNNLTNYTIHRSIKLVRNWDIIEKAQDKTIDIAVKVDPEVIECISNNFKHAHFVEEFKFNYKLDPQRAIEVFEAFSFIKNLIIDKVHISQDQFLGMISPLFQLQELTLCNSSIKTITRKPFYKPYPSLANFEVTNKLSRSYGFLIKIFKNSPQLVSLNISPRYLDSELISHIKKYLINLEEFIIVESKYTIQNLTDIYLIFSQSTKIKKLVLILNSLNRSLDPILLNSPHLEELDLNGFKYCNRSSTNLLVKFSKPVKAKKLTVNCQNLRESIVSTLYLYIIHLNELSINLSAVWKEAIKFICEKCENLQKLTIFRSGRIYAQELDIFCQELFETDLFTSNPKCKSTLTHLTLNSFKAVDSKAEYFKNFERLKSIKYPRQNYHCPLGKVQKIDIDMDLWPGYVLFKKDTEGACDVEFKKL